MKKLKPYIIPLLILFSTLVALLFKWGQTGNPFRTDTILYAIVVFLIILVTGPLVSGLYKRYSLKSSEQLRKGVVPLFLATAGVILVISIIFVSLGTYIFFLAEGYDTSGFMNHLLSVELPGALKQFLVWIVIGSIAFFYIIWRKAADREQKLREENLRFRYRTLKAQVNPHFLFNTLNTLSELIASDPACAEKYLQQLSSIYRYITENEEHDLINVSEELKFLEHFFALQKVRDNDTITLSVQVPQPARYKVVPVSVQLLAENALKHNYGTQDNPVEITVSLENDYIVVTNNINRRSTLGSETSGRGLINLAERIKMVMDREIIIKETNNRFIVKVPLAHAEI